LRSLT